MKVGVLIDWHEQYSAYKTVLRLATHAEELGYDVIWFSDHIVMPASRVAKFSRTWYETITLMSNIAAHTHRIRLGTNVLVAPYRPPLLSARMLSTLDIVSGGRLIIGVGTGFLEEEFQALGAPFEDRGAFAEECIRVWKTLWADGNSTFEGRYVQFRDMVFEPKPVQKPHPPIWIGNRGPRVLRRVAALGDGWHPVGLSFAELGRDTERLRELCRQAGRRDMPVVSYGGLRGIVSDRPAPCPERPLLSGSVEQVTGDLRKLKQMGCGNVVFRPGVKGGTPALYTKQMELIADAVLPNVR